MGLNMWVFFQNNIANFIHMQSLEKKLWEFKAASVKNANFDWQFLICTYIVVFYTDTYWNWLISFSLMHKDIYGFNFQQIIEAVNITSSLDLSHVASVKQCCSSEQNGFWITLDIFFKTYLLNWVHIILYNFSV